MLIIVIEDESECELRNILKRVNIEHALLLLLLMAMNFYDNFQENNYACLHEYTIPAHSGFLSCLIYHIIFYTLSIRIIYSIAAVEKSEIM